jgi:hypothetical protein
VANCFRLWSSFVTNLETDGEALYQSAVVTVAGNRLQGDLNVGIDAYQMYLQRVQPQSARPAGGQIATLFKLESRITGFRWLL